MLIDCQTCVARAIACDDCVVTVLLAAGPPATGSTGPGPDGFAPARAVPSVELDDAEMGALGSLADAGLVPPLRLVRPLGDAQRRDIA